MAEETKPTPAVNSLPTAPVPAPPPGTIHGGPPNAPPPHPPTSACASLSPNTSSLTSATDTRFLTGGCLCSSLRWKLSYHPTGGGGSSSTGNLPSWPPPGSSCHCTQCRKGSGGFTSILLSAPRPNFQWTSSLRTFKEYPSSQFVRRGFCTECGGSLTWRDIRNSGSGGASTDTGEGGEAGGRFVISAATVDEEFYKKDGWVGEEVLGGLQKSWWCGNYVLGVDDGIVDKRAGIRYKEEGPEVVSVVWEGRGPVKK